MSTSTATRAPVQSEYDRDPRRCKPPGTIAWSEHVEAWAVYHRKFLEQSAERIAERGGFGYYELVTLLGHEPRTWEPR